MAGRKVIADSEDEDEGDCVLFDPTDDVYGPEPEPLSPPGRRSSPVAPETHHPQSDVTDPSFFANIYDDQHSLAVKQSHLIENIVRQSQRASASSGDVSLPAQKQGRRVDPSSGTDVTSPIVLGKSRNNPMLLSDGVSEFTSPRKSTGKEWDIPSSPEDPNASNNTKHPPRSRGKTYGKNKRERSRPISSPVAAEEATRQASFEHIGINQLSGGQRTDTMPMPLVKRIKLSHHDDALPDASKFYIAQSNLTTMEKLEYQKVAVSMNSYSGLPETLPNQKSSGVATIPYSTPRGYSPVPSLPWEESLAQPASPQQNEIINIGSSPDVISSNFGFPNEKGPAPRLEIGIPKDRDSPARPQIRTSVNNEKKRALQISEEDELWKDDVVDSNNAGELPESYKSRATKRRSVAMGFSGVGSNIDTLESIPDEVVGQMESPAEFLAPALPDTDPPEPPPEAPAKKRGRKKKQHVAEIPITDEEANEQSYAHQDSTSPHKAVEVEPSLENPKKKRGRPRKSGPSKGAEELLPEPDRGSELQQIDSQNDNNPDKSATAIKRQENAEQMAKGKKSKAAGEVEGTQSGDNRLALKELDSNLKASSTLVSAEESPTKTRVEPNDEIATPKTKLREASKLTASQSKVTYRVGLSKRSRIAPLLKSIKK
ncbi:hypothetical protein F4825DRAFT_348659 [Nemania diffusa]|nr:hypothetical protein F4825DRAFT_348659 [Nemania diffusa]